MINNDLTVLWRMLAVACEWKKLAHVPHFRWLRAPAPEFDFLTFEEAARLVAGADTEWRAMILLGLRTGLRQGELLGLKTQVGRHRPGRGPTDGAPLSSARRGRNAKNGKSREIPLSDDAIATLRSLPSRFPVGLVFAHDDQRMLTKGIASTPSGGPAARPGSVRSVGTCFGTRSQVIWLCEGCP